MLPSPYLAKSCKKLVMSYYKYNNLYDLGSYRTRKITSASEVTKINVTCLFSLQKSLSLHMFIPTSRALIPPTPLNNLRPYASLLTKETIDQNLPKYKGNNRLLPVTCTHIVWIYLCFVVDKSTQQRRRSAWGTFK